MLYLDTMDLSSRGWVLAFEMDWWIGFESEWLEVGEFISIRKCHQESLCLPPFNCFCGCFMESEQKVIKLY